MGGSSKSTQQTSQTDNRRVLGEGAISAETGATVTVLDNGAINRAFDFSQTAVGAAFASQKDSLATLKDAYENAKGRGALTDYILIGAVAMASIVAYSAVGKK